MYVVNLRATCLLVVLVKAKEGMHADDIRPVPPGPSVDLSLGKVVGVDNGKVREFLGIPFAAPPTGKLRWLPPQPQKPWAPKVWNATRLAPSCWRSSTWYTLNPVMREDCLYLNLWAPQPAHVKKHMAVLVWIYGGGYVTGGAESLQTRGDQLVRSFGDVIVVTFNYRLGILGFLGSDKLKQYTWQKTGMNTTGNMGFLDQVMLLKWVQLHIAQFGGDPEKVLLFGESAGAGAVSAHLTSPLSKGLFHRAAMQSGGFNEWIAMSMVHAEGNFKSMVTLMRQLPDEFPRRHWAKRYQCKQSEDDISCLILSRITGRLLTKVADGAINDYSKKSSYWDGMQQCQWGPIVDGTVLEAHPFQLLLQDQWNVMPVIIGFNRDDGTEFVDGCKNGADEEDYPTCNMNRHYYDNLNEYFFNADLINRRNCFGDDQYRHWLGANWGNDSIDALYSMYNSTLQGNFRTNFWAAEHVVGDFVMFCTQRSAAAEMAKKADVFEYYFTHTPNMQPFSSYTAPYDAITEGFGACHGCEIPFVFQQTGSKEYGTKGAGEEELANMMSRYWTNFAWSGNPRDAGDRWTSRSAPISFPPWPRKHGEMNVILFDASDITATVLAAPDIPRATRCSDFWNAYLLKSRWFSTQGTKSGGLLRKSVSWIRRPRNRRKTHGHGKKKWRVCEKTDAPSPAPESVQVFDNDKAVLVI